MYDSRQYDQTRYEERINKNERVDKKNCDDDRREEQRVVLIVYVVGLVLWLFVFLWLKLYTYGFLVFAISMLPIIVFTINTYTSLQSISRPPILFTPDVYISLVYLGVILITALGTHRGIRRPLMNIIGVGFMFNMLAVLPIWVKEKHLYIYHHINSVFVTISLTLIIVTLFVYSLVYFRDCGPADCSDVFAINRYEIPPPPLPDGSRPSRR